MTALLERVYASAPPGESLLLTLTVEHSSFIGLPSADVGGAIRLARAYDNVTATLEDGITSVSYIASGIAVARPEKGVTGRQDLQFQLDNVSGEILQAIDLASEAGGAVTATLRVYLWSDLTAPSEPPVVMRVTSAKVNAQSALISAAFADMINHAWPRLLYTPSFAPGLKYW